MKYAYSFIVSLALAACAPVSTPDGSLGDASSDVANRPDEGASEAGNSDAAMTCSYSETRTLFAGEFLFDGCNTCFCRDNGSISCLGRVCVDASAPPAFESTGADACAPERRRVGIIEHEVRYSCGIPGGPVQPRDSRCQTLCAPVSIGTSAGSYECSRTPDPNVVLCLKH